VPQLSEGDVLAGCRIEAVIGRGGMGVVYRALQLDLQRPVALKVITADLAGDAEFRERFSRESRMAAAIDHPNVVPVYAAGEERGALYLVMRYVAGSDLHALLLRRGSLPVARAAAIVAQVAAALDAAHAAGLVHRDVKPANVLLAAGDADHAYLSDFGLTRSLDPAQPITDSGQWVGTVDFAAPEQLGGGRVDALSDVYSLGCLLYAALTGAPPFRRATLPATLLAHLHDAPPLPSQSGVPEQFDDVVARALAKTPEERYPSAGDLARAALAAAEGVIVRESERTVAVGIAAPDTASERRASAADPAGFDGPPGIGDPALRNTTSLSAAGGTGTRVREPPAPTLPVPRRRRRVGRGALAAALALPVAGIATTAALTLGSPEGEDAAARAGPLAGGEVRAVAQAFADAYEREDGSSLRRLVTSDVRRVLPAGTLRGRDAVATEYERQFRQNATRSYELEDLTASGGRAGRASGVYRVRRADGTSIGGRIVLGVMRDRGLPRIALIAVTPAG